MKPKERQDALLALLGQKGFASVEELCQLLDVSDMTIRRDFADLEKRGLLLRTYGGATLSESAFFEVSFNAKVTQFVEEKRRIGKAAADMVRDRETILIDSGSTTAQMAKHLKNKRLTVVTNALNIASDFLDSKDIEILMCGGMLRKGPMCFVGPQAEEFFENVRCSKVFLGVEGIDSEGVMTVPDLVEAHTKRVLINSAREVIVLADHSKLGRNTLGSISSLTKADSLITGTEADPEILKVLGEFTNVITV